MKESPNTSAVSPLKNRKKVLRKEVGLNKGQSITPQPQIANDSTINNFMR